MTAVEGHLRFDHDALRSAADLSQAGKDARSRVPRGVHGEYSPAADRDPVGILKRQHEHRVSELIPLRLERMTASELAAMPFAAGSMGPKVAAAVEFASLSGHRAAIGSLDQIEGLVAGTAGTSVVPDTEA